MAWARGVSYAIAALAVFAVPAAAQFRTSPPDSAPAPQRRDAQTGVFSRSSANPAGATDLVQANPAVLADEATRERISLELPGVGSVIGRVTTIEYKGGGRLVWSGTIVGRIDSSITLAVSGSVMHGRIVLPGAPTRLFEMSPAANGLHRVVETTARQYPAELPPIRVSSPASAAEQDQVFADNGTTIDVLVAYTPAARAAAGGTAGIQSLIDLAVSNTNLAYANSGVRHRVRLVRTTEVSYTESGSMDADLDRLHGTGDGYMDSVHALRNTSGADLVSLITEETQDCGLGYMMDRVTTSFQSFAFSIVARNCAADNLSLAHELGHNMGLHHDRVNASGSPAYPYAYGYRDEGRFRTVMAYACSSSCPRVAHFSSAYHTYNGRPTGVADDADNARALNNTAVTVANFRNAVGARPFSLYGQDTGADDISSTILNIDETTGASMRLAETGLFPLTDIAFAPDGTMYGVSFDALYRINPATGSVTFLTSIPGGEVNALAGRADGLLYAATTTGSFMTINPASGVRTLIGSYGPGLVSAGDIAIAANGSVHAVVRVDASYDALARINPNTGAATLIGAIGHFNVFGLAYDSTGRLLAAARGDTNEQPVLLQVNPATGAGTPIGEIPNANGLNGLAYLLESCSITVSPGAATYSAAGGVGSLSVIASQPACAWNAVASRSFVSILSGASGVGSGTLTYRVAATPARGSRSATITVAGRTVILSQAGNPAAQTAAADFNGDGRGDVGVFRPDRGRWFIQNGATTDWGLAGDIPVPADYTGSGRAAIAVYRPGTGTWYVENVGTFAWGRPGDIPVPADYDGDRVVDMAVFRPSTGTFYIRNGATITWGAAGDIPVVADYNGDGRADIAVYRPSSGIWYIRDIATVSYGLAADRPVPADYNGDGLADIAVFRPATGTWFIREQYTQLWGGSGDVPLALDRNADGIAELGVFRRATGTWYFLDHDTGSTETIGYGITGDIALGAGSQAAPAARWGDYDGDRKADLTVFRPSSGDWVALRSLSGGADYILRTFGLNGDIPVGRDYDGDGKNDFAVFRPSSNTWYVLLSSSNYATYTTQVWGVAGDIPVPGDYDGDGKADFSVFRPGEGRWYVLLSSSNNATYVTFDWGLSSDVLVPADYDGDGRADPAVFRPSTGRWYVLNRLGANTVADWGLPGDVPSAADFDGDAKADFAVYRPSEGRWFIRSSIDGSYQIVDWGLSGDTLVPADYDGDGKADVAVFRPGSGNWYVRGLFNRSWGLSGDVAALRQP